MSRLLGDISVWNNFLAKLISYIKVTDPCRCLHRMYIGVLGMQDNADSDLIFLFSDYQFIRNLRKSPA